MVTRRGRWTMFVGLLGGCGDATAVTDSGEGGSAGTQDGGSTPTGPGSGDDGSAPTTGDPGCAEDCGDGVCVAGACCDGPRSCGEVCCGEDQVCSYHRCETPGAACFDASDCAADEWCEYTVGAPRDSDGACIGGALTGGRCMPRPMDCLEALTPGAPLLCRPQCEHLPAPSFAPEEKFSWDLADMMMAPIVVQLDDDNCDGVVDTRDIPEIVFSTFEKEFHGGLGTAHAVSIVQGQLVEKWSAFFSDPPRVTPHDGLAAGDIDGLPGNEIVVCGQGGPMLALSADGEKLWENQETVFCDLPTIADLDGDGAPEVIVTGAIFDGATGTIEALFDPEIGYEGLAVDLDGDGTLEIVHPRGAVRADGTVFASTGLEGSYSAVADFDGDGLPEVVVSAKGGEQIKRHLYVWRHDAQAPGAAQIVRAPLDIFGPLSINTCGDTWGRGKGGSPLAISDLNHDGVPDVLVSSSVGLTALDGARLIDPQVAGTDTVLWGHPGVDCDSAGTGMTVFDLDGDGALEVIHADAQKLRVLRGSDGALLWETCNTSGTHYEAPIVADVDADGHAEIVVGANSYSESECDGTKQRGLRIFGDKDTPWMRTRRLWNQHPYHITNVEEDGTIPTVAANNWSTPGLNNFRQNTAHAREVAAPDLVVRLQTRCSIDDYALVARVRNIGAAGAPDGVSVQFFAGDPESGGVLLGTGATMTALLPGQHVEVALPLASPPDAMVHVVVDEAPTHAWQECHTSNNRTVGSGACEP